jgi:hypothetical protein
MTDVAPPTRHADELVAACEQADVRRDLGDMV